MNHLILSHCDNALTNVSIALPVGGNAPRSIAAKAIFLANCLANKSKTAKRAYLHNSCSCTSAGCTYFVGWQIGSSHVLACCPRKCPDPGCQAACHSQYHRARKYRKCQEKNCIDTLLLQNERERITQRALCLKEARTFADALAHGHCLASAVTTGGILGAEENGQQSVALDAKNSQVRGGQLLIDKGLFIARQRRVRVANVKFLAQCHFHWLTCLWPVQKEKVIKARKKEMSR